MPSKKALLRLSLTGIAALCHEDAATFAKAMDGNDQQRTSEPRKNLRSRPASSFVQAKTYSDEREDGAAFAQALNGGDEEGEASADVYLYSGDGDDETAFAEADRVDFYFGDDEDEAAYDRAMAVLDERTELRVEPILPKSADLYGDAAAYVMIESRTDSRAIAPAPLREPRDDEGAKGDVLDLLGPRARSETDSLEASLRRLRGSGGQGGA
eukprot:CAMPEP_0172531742 /NCGR_PEP_ID=MMETSP1067-20121228/5016_1 /TAXON_ID=265564 ORGANISM="Thalassiosira punctigera, Strain Tpunct2005C2" /NCGR_SAMPLE_ID=MMETSP1067 /ASSEMBLY_ACC=CAM_ASM_000444 /LENGTH=211 /DNA_ID=CAMNT_0013316145 /DNA_START=9 /DNA_END=640 /DNA_ORIENTATION=-